MSSLTFVCSPDCVDSAAVSSFVAWLLQAASVATLVNGIVFLLVDGNDATRIAATEPSGAQVADTLLRNLVLVLAFVLPHSILASQDVKDALGLSLRLARALQTVASAASLGALTQLWHSQHDVVLWNLTASPVASGAVNAAFLVGVAALALRLVWVVDAVDADEASSSHPLIAAPAVLLLAAPLMSLSRLLLAASLLLYLLFGNTVRVVDAVHAELALHLHRRKLESPQR